MTTQLPSARRVVRFHPALTTSFAAQWSKDREHKAQLNGGGASTSFPAGASLPDECRDDDDESVLSIVTASRSTSFESQVSLPMEIRDDWVEGGDADVQILNDKVSQLATVIDEDQKVRVHCSVIFLHRGRDTRHVMLNFI